MAAATEPSRRLTPAARSLDASVPHRIKACVSDCGLEPPVYSASPSPKPPKASNAVTVDSAVAKMSASERKAFCKKVTSTPTQVIADLKRWTGKGAGGAISEAYSVCTSYGL